MFEEILWAFVAIIMILSGEAFGELFWFLWKFSGLNVFYFNANLIN